MRPAFDSSFVALALFVGAIGCAHPAPSRPATAAADPVIAPSSIATAPQPLPEILHTVEGLTEYRLPNGLRVLLFPDASKPTITVNMTYFVGSRHEGYGESGMAHLLEHMLFKGTPTRPDIMRLLEEKGGNFNGTTWYDRTNYYETLPAGAENLDFALALEADRMINSKIAAADLAKEFSVVRNEFEIGENDPTRVLEEKMLAAAFEWHNYGKSTIGSRSDIERVPVENLRAFYRKHYQPDNALLVVAGKIDAAETLARVAQHFGSLPAPTRARTPTWTEEPVQDGERTVILRRTGDVAVVAFAYHAPAAGDPRWLSMDALTDLLTRKPAGRLYKALVEKGLATEVFGQLYPTTEPGALWIGAKVRTGVNPEKVRDAMIKVIEGLSVTPLTDIEVERWRAGRLKGWELAMTDSALIGIELSDWAAAGDWRLLFHTRDRAKTLGRTEISRAAEQFLKPANRTLGMFLPTPAPDRSPALQRPDVAGTLKEWKPQSQAIEGESFAATFDNIDARTQRLTLASGMKLALLPKKTKGGSVRIELVLRFGSEADVKGKAAAAQALPTLVLRGTTKHSFEQLQDQLDLLRAEIQPPDGHSASRRTNVASLAILTTKNNVNGVLRLVAEMLKQPAFATKEIENYRKEHLNRLQEQKQDPMENGLLTVLQRLSPWPAGDVRHVPSVTESIAQLSAMKGTELKALHKSLWGAGAIQMSLVGDFDAAAARTLIESEFGGWRALKPYARIDRPYRASEITDETLLTPDKQMAVVALGHSVDTTSDTPDYPALVAMNQILGGGLSSRLWLRIRQREGLSYSVRSDLQLLPLDSHGIFIAYAMCAPQNAAKALTALDEEIKKLHGTGVTDAELAEAKKSIAAEWETHLADDAFVARELTQLMFQGKTMAHWKSVLERISKLSAADVSAVAKKYLRPEALTRIKAGDLAPKAESAQ